MSPGLEMRTTRAFAAELKFLLPAGQAAQVRAFVGGALVPDPHAAPASAGSYRIRSLYFDTPDRAVYHQRGSFARSKYRLRRYDAAAVVFLERKLKHQGNLTKRRSVVPATELVRLSAGQPARGWAGHWFHRRLLARGLEPVCQLSYRREALVARTAQGSIRLTLDHDLRAQPLGWVGFAPAEAGRPLLPDQVVLELKFTGPLPPLFQRLVEELLLVARPLSKYRLAAGRLGCVPTLPPPVTQPLSLTSHD